jgi:hypothetical protein
LRGILGKIKPMETHRHLPNADRLSIITAMILLSYALASFIKLPAEALNIQLPAFFFQLPLTINSLIGIATAALAASGTQWLLSAHPEFSARTSVSHLFIPALTAMIIGLPLSTLQASLFWWVVFAFGGALFVLVAASEYIAMDNRDSRQALAAIALTAVSWALFLIVAISVRAAGMRFYLILLILFPTVFLVSLRSLYLRLGGVWSYPWALSIAVIISQVALGLHYLPLSPLSYGLILLGAAYALTSIAGSVIEHRPWKLLWVEPAVITGLMFLLAFLVR